jgi:hypothetical protein
MTRISGVVPGVDADAVELTSLRVVASPVGSGAEPVRLARCAPLRSAYRAVVIRSRPARVGCMDGCSHNGSLFESVQVNGG